MKITDYKKLDKEISNYSFSSSYSNINVILRILSYLGNIASIFLAYFFMYSILSDTIGNNQFMIVTSSIVILLGVELLKRDIFDKFSIQSLKDKSIKKSALPLAFLSLIFIFLSFYSSLDGAKKFSSKSEEIEVITDNKFEIYRDSLIGLYDEKISVFEQRNKILFEQNLKFDEEASKLPANYITAKQKIRSNKKINIEQIDTNSDKIETLKTELQEKLNSKKKELGNKSEKQKDKNKSNSLIFIILSTLIEIIILAGVYFNEYYKFRSYREFKKKIDTDPIYQKWAVYDNIYEIVIPDNSKINEKLPSYKSLMDICKVNDVIVLPKDIQSFMKMLSNLGIVKLSGNAKYIIKEKEVGRELLRKHFKIE